MFISPEFSLSILPLPVLYVRQAESQLIPIMKQTSLIEFDTRVVQSIVSLVVHKNPRKSTQRS